MRQHHFEKLTPEEVEVMAEKLKGKTSPSSKLPARSPKASSSLFSLRKIAQKRSGNKYQINVSSDKFFCAIQYFGQCRMGCFC